MHIGRAIPGRDNGESATAKVVDGIGVFFNLTGWVFAVWAPVAVGATMAIAALSAESWVTLWAGGIAFFAALVWVGVGIALIRLSRQMLARRARWIRLGTALCLLLAVVNVALVAFGVYDTAEQIAGGVTWAIVLAVAGVSAIAQRPAARAPRQARG